MKRGVLTLADLRAHCRVDYDTGCWHWLGATSMKWQPRIWTLDHERIEKRLMSGPKAAWNIAHQAAPRAGWLVYRRCVVRDCVCPVHLGLARDQAEIGMHIRLSGRHKGDGKRGLDSQRANQAKACAARGIKVTPRDVVLACRAAGPEVSNPMLAEIHGIHHSTVSRIRLGQSHRGVVA